MKKQFIFAALFFAASTMFVSCSENNGDDDDPEVDSTVLSGEISEDVTLMANTSYTLDGALVVNEGATLYIEEGVKITAVYDDLEDYILIKQGAKINAQGTATNPIVMTSDNKTAGAWGGIHICGKATTNLSTSGVSEIGNAPYGGTDDADNSGILRYIRLEYTGFAFDEETESNGVTFYGVGSGTTVEYLQAYRGADDGYEFFGGTVNVKYLVATSCSDDSFDWTEGWRGKAQFLIAYHEDETELGYVCDCLFEADNNGDDNNASPMSRPTIANVTLVGNNSTTKNDGVMLKAGTQVELHNAIITGKTYPIYTKTSVTEDALKSGASVLKNILMTGELYSAVGTYTNDDFLAVLTNSNDYVFNLEDNYIGTVASESGSTPTDSFFTTADYKGAVEEGNDWTAGWVINGDEVIESVDTYEVPNGTTLEGRYYQDVTLKSGNSYPLSGALVIEAGATLTIEEGVTLTAINDDLEDYILIKQGAKIDAQGTADKPIVMTSESQKAGAWGGIHICGYATTNLGTTGVSEIGNAPYGGSDDADNSGILRYIRLEYTGFAFDEETESNGVTFYGVGNGTTVEYLQAYRGADDGFEFFGGTVDVKYLIATSCSDDSFDWTEGWRGRGQFLIAYHEAENELGYVCDCLLEADNNGDDNSASPMSHPVLSNLTLVGNNSATKTDGVMLKAGTQVELYNTIITGKTYPIYTKTEVTENALVDGSSILDYIVMTGELKANQGIYSNDLFASSANNSTEYVNALANNYYGTIAGASVPTDSFFTAVDYKGAISESNDWLAGWTK